MTTDASPTGGPAATGARHPAGPPARHRRRRWLVAVTVLWALVLAAAGVWAVRHDPATVREQVSAADSKPVVDSVIATAVLAADPTSTVAAISGYQRTGSCRLTPVRRGARYRRTATVYTRPGGEPGLLDRVAAGMPADWAAGVRHTGGTQVLRADAGSFVAVRGIVAGRGEVRIDADTGCRPAGEVPGDGAPGDPAVRARATAVLDRLHAAAGSWSYPTVDCPAGGRLTTATTTGTGAGPARLSDVATPPVLLDRDDVVAYRSGDDQVVLRRGAGGTVVVSVTQRC